MQHTSQQDWSLSASATTDDGKGPAPSYCHLPGLHFGILHFLLLSVWYLHPSLDSAKGFLRGLQRWNQPFLHDSSLSWTVAPLYSAGLSSVLSAVLQAPAASRHCLSASLPSSPDTTNRWDNGLQNSLVYGTLLFSFPAKNRRASWRVRFSHSRRQRLQYAK